MMIYFTLYIVLSINFNYKFYGGQQYRINLDTPDQQGIEIPVRYVTHWHF